MPVLNEEKEPLETAQHEPSTDTFRSDAKQAITHNDVIRDTLTHQNTATIPSQDNIHPNTACKTDQQIIKTEVDVDNPLYMTHNSLSNDDSMDCKESKLNSKMPLLDCNQITSETDHEENDENDYENGSEFDYENTTAVRLAKLMVKQGVSLLSPGPTSPTTPKPATSKQVRGPETKPKPKHRQRSQSTQSDVSQNEPVHAELPNVDSVGEEPHYMSPRQTNPVPWQAYKELDFSTVEPTGEYMTPTRDYLIS